MGLFGKLFYRKATEGLLEIAERVYVFDCCFTVDVVEDENYKTYIRGIIDQLRGHLPEASFMVFNFREGENPSQILNILSEYDMTVMEYPRQYEGCPLLTMGMIHHFLRSSESWLLLGKHNVILMHCERGGWPILAFMLAALLIYRKVQAGEHRTLEMIHKQAPHELLSLILPLNPLPSQLRYLLYVLTWNVCSEWPPEERALSLDCMIIRLIPNMNGQGGCRPILKIYGQDAAPAMDWSSKVLVSMPKKSKTVRYYKQVDCELVKLDVHCHVRGDVVLECISLDDDMEHEEMMFRVMFNTAFIRSNILMLSRDEIDTLWNTKDQFPKDFRAEVLLSEIDAAAPLVRIDIPSIKDKEGHPEEAFAKVQENFSKVDWLGPKSDIALNVLQTLTASTRLKKRLEADSDKKAESGSLEESPAETSEEQSKSQMSDSNVNTSTPMSMENQTGISPGLVNPIAQRTEPQNKAASHFIPEQRDIVSDDTAESGCVGALTPSKTMESESSQVSKNNGPIPMALEKQSKSSAGPYPDANLVVKKSHAEDLLPALRKAKIISPRILQSSRSSSVLHGSSLQGSPVAFQRFHSAPSSLGITALLHDHAAFGSEEAAYSEVIPRPSCVRSAISVPDAAKLSDPGTATALPLPRPPVLMLSPPKLQPALFASSLSHGNVPTASKAPMTAPSPSTPLPDSQPSTSESETFSSVHGNGDRLSPRMAPSPPPPLPPKLPMSPSTSFSSSKYPSYPLPPPSPLPPGPRVLPSTDISSSNYSSPHPPSPLLPIGLPSSPSTSVSSLKYSAPPPPPPPPFRESLSVSGVDSSSSSPKASATLKCLPPPPPPPPPQLSSPSSSLVSSSSAHPPPPPPKAVSEDPRSRVFPQAPPVPLPPAPVAKGLAKSKGSSQQSQAGGSHGSVPPAPGPPIGAKGRLQPRITPRSQGQSKRTNLKPYHWLKLTRVMQGSLWAEAQKSDKFSKAPDFDLSELETLFAASIPDSEHGSTGGKSSRRGSGSKLDKVQLIELRRAYNCEIMLTKVKIPLSDLMASVLTLDDSALDVDQVENLIKFCPTKEEMELLKGYNGDKENLGKCELFFIELMKVPRPDSKLRVFSFKIQFASQVSELRKNLNIVNSTTDEIRNSVKLRRIMQAILSLGNVLNHGTARGSAVGFRLDSLLKLADTRAQNSKMTLMHYLCKVLAEKQPELLDFSKDLVTLEASTKIQLKFLAEEMQAISKGLEKVIQELTASENDGPVSENFCKNLKQFLAFAEGEVRSLASLYSDVGRSADALAIYFGEDPARCPFEQVVSTLLNFVRMFTRAHEENIKQLEFEKKKAEKEAKNEKSKMSLSPHGSEHRHAQTGIKSVNVKGASYM